MKKAIKKRSKNMKFQKKKEMIKSIITAELPPAIESQMNLLSYAGCAILALSIGMLFFSSFRSTAPFGLFLSVLLLGMAYFRKREVVLDGYKEEVFEVLDYTYSTPIYQKKPTGLLLIHPKDSRVFHIPAGNRSNVPPIGRNLRVYIPKDATATEFRGQFYYNKVFGYALEA